jgi:hypothetical protein
MEGVRPASSIPKHGRRTRGGLNVLLDLHPQDSISIDKVAGVMSALIPGSGHIYAGHYGYGITAFFLNGLFIAGTVTAVRQENYAVAGVVGVIGLPFYIGNIYGAANAATKYMIGVKRDVTISFEDHLSDLEPDIKYRFSLWD